MRIVINEDSNSLKVENANKKYKQKQMHFLWKNPKNVIPRTQEKEPNHPDLKKKINLP